MWTFSGYEKMADSVAAWGLNPAGLRRLGRVPWVVTEKIHGANFCFITDSKTVQCANRRHVLADEDSFFGYESVRDALREPVLCAFARLKAGQASTNRILIYGELFGGGYPHPDVPAVAGVQPIQTGVWYAPDIRFAAFDLRVETSEGTLRYLDYESAMAVFADAGIPFAAPLRVGSYEAALNFPLGFDSTLPRALGLPPLPPGSNSAEGVVLKPLREVVLANADETTRRPILKRKIAHFAEDRRFHAAENWQDTSASSSLPAKRDAVALLEWEVYNRVTENRLDAALSKVGPRPQGAVGAAGRRHRSDWARELFTLLTDEVLSEATKAEASAFASLGDVERNVLTAYAHEQVRVLLKERSGR